MGLPAAAGQWGFFTLFQAYHTILTLDDELLLSAHLGMAGAATAAVGEGAAVGDGAAEVALRPETCST